MNDWMPFTGHYDKKWYDIKTKQGSVVAGCWPNAGMFVSMDNDHVPVGNVDYVRECPDPMWEAVSVRKARESEVT